LPGIDPGFSLSGYTLEKSFFGYVEQEESTTFGLKKFSLKSDYTDLVYIVMMTRDLLYDFIVFLVPLFIIFFSLYTVFSITQVEHIKGIFPLSAYTGLVFLVIMLHRALREQRITNDILYIEYLFFMIYITFALLVTCTLLADYKGRFHRHIQSFFNLFHIFFWPVQFLIVLIITIFVFYPR